MTCKISRIIEIKAKLYDLRTHSCNGYVFINPDTTVDMKPCEYCDEIIKLKSELDKLVLNKNG